MTRVLIIDDDEDQRFLTEQIASRAGCTEIVTMVTVEEGFAALNNCKNFDLVITDNDTGIGMKGEDLAIFCQKNSLPVILLTGEKDAIQRARKIGITALLKASEDDKLPNFVAIIHEKLGQGGCGVAAPTLSP